MPATYPAWTDDTPHSHPYAHATRMRNVSNVLAIKVTGAKYRGSKLIDGVFELVSGKQHVVNSGVRYEVYCAWFGVKPKKIYPRIDLRIGNFELIAGYSGPVIDDISADLG